MYMFIMQISQIHTRLFEVVGPGLVSTSPAFVRSSASHPASPHGRITKNGISGPLLLELSLSQLSLELVGWDGMDM